MPCLRRLAERQKPPSTARRNLFAAVEMRGPGSVICEVSNGKELNAMIDLYTAAVCANLSYSAPALLSDIRKGLARLVAGLVLLCCVYGILS